MKLLMLLAVYGLSFGPVLAMYSSQRLQGPVPAGIMTLYEPMAWLHAHTPMNKPMTVYEDWWKRVLSRS